jgi:ABC-type bacteriocin/lantibiotic exporter with double-glycine peptidase domain
VVASQPNHLKEARFRGNLARGIESYKTIRLFFLHSKAVFPISSTLDKYLRVLYERIKTSGIYQATNSIFLSLAESVVLVLVAIDVFMGNLTIVTLKLNLCKKSKDFIVVSGFAESPGFKPLVFDPGDS